CNRGELARAADSLAAMLEDKLVSKGISAENRENAQFLRIKLQLKALAAEYFCAGYERGDFIALESFARQAAAECAELGFKKTGGLVNRVFESAKAIDSVMFDAVALKERICDGEGRCVAANADECRSVSLELKRKITLVNGLELPENIFSDGAEFPNVKVQTVSDLTDLCTVAEKMSAAFCAEHVKEYMRTAAEDITETLRGKHYEYFPDADVSRLARAIVLFTPFPDEAELFANVNADGAKVYRLQCLAFENVEDSVVSEVFANLSNLGADCVIYGMPHFRAKNGGNFYRAVMRFCRGGRRAYIVADDGTRTVYDQALKAATDGLTALDISFLYLTMPDFVQTVELMQKLGMLSSDGGDIDFVRKNMPFVGFAGFNSAVKAFNAGADWKKVASECSQDNFRAASKYMLRLSRQALFIDGGWGN
ncbi:MAG: hypothetical protein K2J54_01725, partial [Clostridia bacterium]|nr:hypothetical protein [Clostridia bacterium]